MARVLVASDDGATMVPIAQTGVDGDWTEGVCPCGEAISDRGHFEDTVQAVQVHVDQRH
jgi:hypothetical protein